MPSVLDTFDTPISSMARDMPTADATFSNESQWAIENAPRWNDKDQLIAPDGTVLFDDRARNGGG